MEKIIITAADGYRLSALYATPPGESAGSIIISSGTGIRKEFYINFTRNLVQNGYKVLLYDYRGVGGSAPADIKTSKAFMHEWGTMDMNAALNYLVTEKGLTGIIWIGHSIGAQLVGFLDNKHHLKKVIALSAAVGHWSYFPFPKNIGVWLMWHIVSPVLIKIYGYGTMKKVGWGEDLPKNVILEWRKWCMSKNYFMAYLKKELNADRFYNFTTPITAVYISDDYIANDKTVPLMMQFFPNAPVEILKIAVKEYTRFKVGHTGIFSRKFENNLWLLLTGIIAKQ
jgi:predicted alpha/beta hydrolase